MRGRERGNLDKDLNPSNLPMSKLVELGREGEWVSRPSWAT